MNNKLILFEIVKTIKEKIDANIFITSNTKGEIKLHIINRRPDNFNYSLMLNEILIKHASFNLEDLINDIMNDYYDKRFQRIFSL